MTDMKLTLDFNDISEAQALALAQFVKRLQFDDIEAKAVDRDEAYTMRDAVEKLQWTLADAGYDPH